MRKLAMTAFSLGLLAAGATSVTAQEMQMPTMADTEEVVIEGTVVDMSCKLVYNLTGDMHRECAQVCADRGIPLGILGDDGTFYLPVSAAMPGNGANDMLRGHAEHHVTVRGKRLTRAGMSSIIIESVSMQ